MYEWCILRHTFTNSANWTSAEKTNHLAKTSDCCWSRSADNEDGQLLTWEVLLPFSLWLKAKQAIRGCHLKIRCVAVFFFSPCSGVSELSYVVDGFMVMNSLARIWKVPVRKKRPPFCKVKSWQKKRKRDRQLKMMDRIIRAWTA